MKKIYRAPSLVRKDDNADLIRTSGLFDPQNATEQQALDDFLASFGVKAGIAKYTK